MKRIIIILIILNSIPLIKAQELNASFGLGYSKAGKHYNDIPLEFQIEYFPLSWISVFTGYEKFNASYNEFDIPRYAFYGIGFNSQFSYSLFKLGFNYYPLIHGRSKVALGGFIGRGLVSRNSTPFISYLDSRQSVNSEKIYEIAIISGDYRKFLTASGFQFIYSYQVIKDMLSLGIKFDYTGFRFQNTFKYYVPEIVSVKLSIGMSLNKPE